MDGLTESRNIFNEDLCRGCLSKPEIAKKFQTSHSITICSKDGTMIEMISLAEMYTQCIGIEMDLTWDCLCENCVQKLVEFFKFRQMCQKSLEHLIQQECSRNKVGVKTELEAEIVPGDEAKEIFEIFLQSDDENSMKDEIEYNESEEEAQTDQKNIVGTHKSRELWDDTKTPEVFEKPSTFQTPKTFNHSDEPRRRNKFQCDICDKAYVKKYSLRCHILEVHVGQKMKKWKPSKPKEQKERTPLVCEQCGKIFFKTASLAKHHYVHTRVSKHKCSQCGKMFATAHKLKEHMMRHQGIRNHICQICGLKKTTGTELRNHMLVHSNDNKRPCELCPRIFSRTANLTRHMKIVHCGIKAYPCTHCDRSFGKQETLKHHIMTHTGERPHACTYCDKRFIQVVALRAHLRVHQKKLK